MLENVKTKKWRIPGGHARPLPRQTGRIAFAFVPKNDKYKTQSDKGEGPCKMKGEGINCAFDASDDTWIVL